MGLWPLDILVHSVRHILESSSGGQITPRTNLSQIPVSIPSTERIPFSAHTKNIKVN